MKLSRDFKNPRFWKSGITHSLAALGVLSIALGLFDLFVPDTLGQLGLPEILLVPVSSVVYALWRSWARPVEQHFATPDTKVRLVTGDLFEQQTNLVIGMTDTFDTSTPHIIASASVQGQFLEKVYQQDENALRRDLRHALLGRPPTETVIKEGNTQRYALGTVATIRKQRQHFFCLAYTSLDEHNKASSSMGTLWEAMEQLWREVRIRSNGEAVSTPLIGLGQSGLSTLMPIQDAVRFLILSFVFASRRDRVCGELRIVVRPEDEARIDMLEIQDFLNSLKKSR